MTAEDRHPTIEAWLANADQALTDAALLLANQSLTGTLNRCYYAMFYAASALVIRDGGLGFGAEQVGDCPNFRPSENGTVPF